MVSSTFLVQVALCVSNLPLSVQAFWRLPCQARSGLGRIDPIYDPGVPSGHVHALHGAGNLGFSSTFETLRTAECTSCQVPQDKSAYWTPALYFQHANGSFELLDQVGGMLAYYLIRNDTSGFSGVQGFPAGFQVIAGDSERRTFNQPIPDPPQSLWTPKEQTQSALEQKAIGFNCLNYQKPPEPSLWRHFMPDKEYLDANCTDGIRLELAFPSCWNGVNVTVPDHYSHMAYPDLVMNDYCPPGFPVRLVSLFYETIWNTYAFKNQSGRFVFSNGDTTGFGYHGDFMAGWDPDFLQSAVDTCTNLSGEVTDCPLFAPELQSLQQQSACAIPTPSAIKNENPVDPGKVLLGDDPVTGENDVPEPLPHAAQPAHTPAASQPSTTTHQIVVPALSSQPAIVSATATYLPPIVKEYSNGALGITEAPQVAVQASPSYASTSWSTNGNSVYEIYIVDQEATKVVVETRVLNRRHMHHRHKHEHLQN